MLKPYIIQFGAYTKGMLELTSPRTREFSAEHGYDYYVTHNANFGSHEITGLVVLASNAIKAGRPYVLLATSDFVFENHGELPNELVYPLSRGLVLVRSNNGTFTNEMAAKITRSFSSEAPIVPSHWGDSCANAENVAKFDLESNPSWYGRMVQPKPIFRPDTQDLSIYDEVHLADSYRMRKRNFSGKTVLDIGLHIGSFTKMAFDRGAQHVVSVEPTPGNFAVASWNLQCWLEGRAMAWMDDVRQVMMASLVDEMSEKSWLGVRAAAWSCSGQDLIHAGYSENTGGGGIDSHGGLVVKSVAFDDLVDVAAASSHNGRVHLCKVDCEGGEWPCLYPSKKLDLIDELAIEIHEGCEDHGTGRVQKLEALSAFLRDEHGFAIDIEHRTGPAMGMLFASRR